MNTDPQARPTAGRSAAGAVDKVSPYKSRGGPGRLWRAARYSLQGLADAVRREAAFRQELLLAAVLSPFAILFPFSGVERVLLLGVLLLILIVELLNSALEAAVDMVSIEQHPMAGRAKDLGSAAVMLSLLLAALTWIAIAGPVFAGLLLPGGL